MFQVIQPSNRLAPYVKQYWILSMDQVEPSYQRLIPFGSVALGFHQGDRAYSSAHGTLLPSAHVLGQSSSYTDLAYAGNVRFIGVVFQSAGARAFFKLPLGELQGQIVALDALGDPLLVELEKRLMDCPDLGKGIEMLERFLFLRISRFEGFHYERFGLVLDAIDQGSQNVRALAQTACLGYKQFARVFTDHIGANPKDFMRIIRFQQLLRLMQEQPQCTLNQLADDCSFYDKSHLIKDMNTFLGYSPKDYLSVCGPYPWINECRPE